MHVLMPPDYKNPANWHLHILKKSVVLAEARIQNNIGELDSSFRRNDKNGKFSPG